ncbi:hypothetical protein [Streptomyces sp. NPDC059009]|uniref:hypothetical protein n=1 Tax=Streptomyces sp. NPDC059009 TaxID=3346694 RepID=UPI00369E5E36
MAHTVNTVKRTRKALAMAAVTAGLVAGIATAPAATADVRPAGYEPSTVTYDTADCKAWINTAKRNGHWYAQGVVQAGGSRCAVDLERYHNGRWTVLTTTTSGRYGQAKTAYYWDHRGYKARVCVSNIDWHNYCVWGGAV